MGKELINKVIAVILILTLTIANVILLATEVYAEYEALEEQGIATNNKNVKFDSYFKNGENKVHSISKDVNDNEFMLYFYISSENGYLKDGKISIDNPNFKITATGETIESVKSIVNNEISLNQVSSGHEKEIRLSIAFENQDMIDVSYLNRENTVHFTGTYVGSDSKEIAITKDIKMNLKWEENLQVQLAETVSKYVPYDINNQQGLLMQSLITSKLDMTDKNKTYPINNTNINVAVPAINGVYPDKVTVTAQSTKTTNGSINANFTYNYDSANKNLQITTTNPEVDGKIWGGSRNDSDEYLVTYVYPKAVYDYAINKTTTKVVVNSSITANLAMYDGKTISNQVANSYELKEKVEDITSYTMRYKTTEISKGYMYANLNSETKPYETEFDFEWFVNVADKDLVDNLKITAKDQFIHYIKENQEKADREDTVINNVNYTYYKQTVISKKVFEEVLGTDGYIDILDNNGNKINTINKDTTLDENGNYVIDYENKPGEIILETSKPISEGNLIIYNKKAIKADIPYSREVMKDLEKLYPIVYGETKFAGSTEYTEFNGKALNIKLNETATNSTLEINKESLSTVATNENVEFRVILNDNNNTSDLYINPTFKIELPSSIKTVNIKSVNILYNDELTIISQEVKEENGKKYLYIATSGTETRFNASTQTNGTNIIVNTDIETYLETPTSDEEIKLYTKNENVNKYSQEETISNEVYGVSSKAIKMQALSGLLSYSKISNFDDNKTTVYSLKQGEVTGKIATGIQARTAKMQLTVINNLENACDGVTVLGRIPFSGNKAILTNEDLGSTIDTTLKTAISAEKINSSKITIYYSTNGEATKDINDSNNGWTTTPSDLGTVKSYLIVTNNYQMEKGAVLKFNYDFEIPANLEVNNQTFGTFATYYNNTQTATQEQTEADKVGLTTGQAPQLDVKLDVSVGNGTRVNEGQRLKYTITVQNTGKSDVNNVVITAPIPEGTTYTEYKGESGTGFNNINDFVNDETIKEKTWNKDVLKTGEKIEQEFYVETNRLSSEESLKIQTQINVTSDGLDRAISSEIIENIIEKSEFIIKQKTNFPYNPIQENINFSYEIFIQNISGKTINNTIAKYEIPEGATYKKAYFVEENGNQIEEAEGIEYDESTRVVTWKIGNSESEKNSRLRLFMTSDKLEKEVYEKDIVSTAKISGDNTKEYISGEVKTTVAKPKLIFTITSPTQNEKVKVGDEIEYNITIKNEGKIFVSNMKFTDILPDSITATYISYKTKDSNISMKLTGENNISIPVTFLSVGETMEVTIKGIVNEEYTDTNISNSATITGDNIEEITSDEIKHTIKEDKDDDNNNDDDENKTYQISGTAWVDENEDGIRDNKEEVLGGYKVSLWKVVYDEEKSQEDVEEIKNTETSNDGIYVFDNLENGKYIVKVEYDYKKYDLTEYRKDGVNEALNSDFVGMLGAAITDIITIEDKSISNIDIGLIKNKEFDLRLDKTVSKIIVQNNSGTSTYNYNDSKLAKVEIAGKQLASSNVIIEYKIKITNEGQASGYIGKIADYMPQNAKFSSELNKDWYQDNNGNLYNTSLYLQKINPGETKEVSLVLTKKMTESNTGRINNTAEIFSACDEKGLISDIDSTPANKQDGEDDMSSADVLIGVKTGRTVLYITLTLTCITIIGIGAYYTNKKVLGNK